MRRTHSAGGVVINPSNMILVVNQHGNSWSLPKGHIDTGENTIDAAKREILEETGIKDLTFIKELGSYERYRIGLDVANDDKSELKTIHMLLFKTEETRLAPTDPDNPIAKWSTKEEVTNLLTHPKDKAFFEKIKGELI
ncbi:MAG: NUDIX domain-containing protein [bacterium]